MPAFDDIPELVDLQSGRSLIRVPSEQNIPFTPRVRALVDTEEFQRLSEISQLGLVAKVYPGARHTRFEHALGVYHNALRYLQQLGKDPRFRERVDGHAAELLIVSSLLHDLGHWPFCHPIEDMGLQELPPHEVHAARYLGDDTELADVLRSQWGIEPREVLGILAPRKEGEEKGTGDRGQGSGDGGQGSENGGQGKGEQQEAVGEGGTLPPAPSLKGWGGIGAGPSLLGRGGTEEQQPQGNSRDHSLNPRPSSLHDLQPSPFNPQPASTSALLRSILSGPIDVDKMDYLDRDSLHCGVPYGRNFDRQRLIQSLVLNEAGDGLAITVKGKTAAELMVFARYVMFSEVYWHHAVRSATSMFARAFFELHSDVNVRDLFQSSDAEMIATLRAAARDLPCERLLEGVFGRKRSLYKQAAEYSHDQSPEVYRRVAGRPYAEVAKISNLLAQFVNDELGARLDPCDLLVDAPPPHREVEFLIDVYFPKQDLYRPLRTVSPVVEALATTQFDDWVKRVRVFVSPRWRDAVRKLDWDAGLLWATEE